MIFHYKKGFDEKSKQTLAKQMQKLTHLENPNSVQQMKTWLSENELETESLGKKVAAELIQEAPDHLAEVLTLRQQPAKSSVKKYTVFYLLKVDAISIDLRQYTTAFSG